MRLLLSPLQDAVQSLERAVAEPKNEFVTDAVIQRFEYTYELSWKFIKRDLTEDLGAEAVNLLSRRDLFRTAADRALIQEPQSWFQYHEARNQTCHVYNLAVAEATYQVAKAFVLDARTLLSYLERKHA